MIINVEHLNRKTIMKKTYINPEVMVVKLQPTQMLATSIDLVEGTPSEWGSREFDYDEEDDI